MEHLVSKYLKYLNIPVSRKYCEKLIASHPDYPSLLSIADMLERLGIPHKAARIEKESLANLECPYLLWLEEKDGELKFIKDQQDLATANKTGTDDTYAVVLQAEPTDTIADEENNKQRSEEIFFKISSMVLISAVAGLLLLSGVWFFSWIQGSLLLTALAGTVVGYLLIAKDLGITYHPVETFCKARKKTNCDAILYSEAARPRVFGGNVTFSDATASYFLFQLFVVGFLLPAGEGTASFLWVLAVLSGLAVPVVGYSLYYQAVQAKTWCGLCLIVDAVLILQAALFGYMYYEGLPYVALTKEGILSTMNTGMLPLINAGLLFVATVSSVLLLKTKFKAATRSEQAEIAANRIRYAPDIFTYLLGGEKHVDATPFEQELLIGNPEAPIKLIMAASLGCGPCKEGFEKAKQLVAAYPDKVSLSVRLRPSSGSDGNITPGTWLLGYWQQHIHGKPDGPARTEKLIRDWYELMDPEKFKIQYPLEINDRDSREIKMLEARHGEWLDQADITATPTFFVNGWRLPKPYRIDDLMGMVPALADRFVNGMIREESVPDVAEELADNYRSGQ